LDIFVKFAYVRVEFAKCHNSSFIVITFKVLSKEKDDEP